MMDIFEDEVCSQDDFFVAPPLTIKHNPLPYLSESCFQKPCESAAARTEQTKDCVTRELNSRGQVSVLSNSATIRTMPPKLQEQTQYSHMHGFALTVPVTRNMGRKDMELTTAKHNSYMNITCRYSLKLQGWSPDTIFPLDKSSCLEKRGVPRAGCLKRPAVDLFHPRQLKAVRHL